MTRTKSGNGARLPATLVPPGFTFLAPSAEGRAVTLIYANGLR